MRSLGKLCFVQKHKTENASEARFGTLHLGLRGKIWHSPPWLERQKVGKNQLLKFYGLCILKISCSVSKVQMQNKKLQNRPYLFKKHLK